MSKPAASPMLPAADSEPFFTANRKASFMLIFLVEGPIAVATIILWFLAADGSAYATMDTTARVNETLGQMIWPAFYFFSSWWACARAFDTSSKAEDVLGANVVSERFVIAGKTLQNSVEQFIIFLPSILALAVHVQGENFKAVPVLIHTWTVGRFLFFFGYWLVPQITIFGVLQYKGWGRSPGMNLTLYSTSFALLGAFLLRFQVIVLESAAAGAGAK